MHETPATSVDVVPEQAGDEKAISDLTERAFTPMPFSEGDEQGLINVLRDHDALTISLVAKQDDKIVGHIAFSPAFPDDGSDGWYTLGPVSVEPELQKMGVGSQMIRKGLNMLQDRNANGCILIGNPEYYRRFGFEAAPESCPDGEPAEYYQMIWFGDEKPQQVIGFHKLFHAETN
ncbi:MAG: N-acetyltransferase [Parasphingorhabdus sp.]